MRKISVRYIVIIAISVLAFFRFSHGIELTDSFAAHELPAAKAQLDIDY